MSLNLMKSLRNAVVAGVLLSAGLANAALLQFNLTGDYTASWQLNSTGTPDDGANGVGFVIYDVPGQFPGSALDLADLYFYNADQGGGLEIYDYYNDFTLLLTDGQQLYTGTEEGIVSFILGTFILTDFDGPGTYTLTVTDLDAGPGPGTDPGEVPEPATAAMMFGGLGLMYALRKRRNRH
jgi:hypothetical protein